MQLQQRKRGEKKKCAVLQIFRGHHTTQLPRVRLKGMPMCDYISVWGDTYEPPVIFFTTLLSPSFLFPTQKVTGEFRSIISLVSGGSFISPSVKWMKRSQLLSKEKHWSAKWMDAQRALCSPLYIIRIHTMTSEASFHGDTSGGNVFSCQPSFTAKLYCFLRKNILPW